MPRFFARVGFRGVGSLIVSSYWIFYLYRAECLFLFLDFFCNYRLHEQYLELPLFAKKLTTSSLDPHNANSKPGQLRSRHTDNIQILSRTKQDINEYPEYSPPAQTSSCTPRNQKQTRNSQPMTRFDVITITKRPYSVRL